MTKALNLFPELEKISHDGSHGVQYARSINGKGNEKLIFLCDLTEQKNFHTIRRSNGFGRSLVESFVQEGSVDWKFIYTSKTEEDIW